MMWVLKWGKQNRRLCHNKVGLFFVDEFDNGYIIILLLTGIDRQVGSIAKEV